MTLSAASEPAGHGLLERAGTAGGSMTPSALVTDPEETLIEHPDQLLEPFTAAERPRSEWRVGLEMEQFGVWADTLEPLGYSGERGVVRVLNSLATRFGWQPRREVPGGPVIGLERGRAAVSLEPGAQVELDTAPCLDLHELGRELEGGLEQLHSVGRQLGCQWLYVGFHPLATQASLPWVPKRRYAVMRQYLPTRGAGAWDMMRRTASLQASFDYESESDALRKLVVALRLAPLLQAMTANSPFYETRVGDAKSRRGLVWLEVDRSRTGLVPRLWSCQNPGYRDYVDWALDAGMFFIVRDGRLLPSEGQTFREFLVSGFRGYRATMNDWWVHLSTLFPEVRLRRTIEVRSSDAVPPRLALAVASFLTGILYDAEALEQTQALLGGLGHDLVQAGRTELARHALESRIGTTRVRPLAERLVDIATQGLVRRKRGEEAYLLPLAALVSAGRSPADALIEQVASESAESAQKIVGCCRVDLTSQEHNTAEVRG